MIPKIGVENWAETCLARADRRAVGHIIFAVVAFGGVLMIHWLWLTVLAVPVALELAAPGLRHFFQRRGTLQLIERFPFRPVSVSFVPGRRIGRQAYLKVHDSEKNLRLPELPERARVLVRLPSLRAITAFASPSAAPSTIRDRGTSRCSAQPRRERASCAGYEWWSSI
ncbi:hypothetical protein ABZX92_08240 [Lentzea sp. NPDC006480]|uniref:hypothetical protein n=1 Tax=Lentzea sp. NPDC006480 TaxID=3157176 RepID=UPI0033AFE62B